MSSAACFVWFVGFSALTAFFAYIAMWAKGALEGCDKGLLITICAVFGVCSFIGAIAFLAGAVG